ncbi:MAG: ribosome small subunit-dependent GTPase A [Spirochaetaceae bacterium]|nr:MAG: ribosome small subunit-dependent GTPase A [Spirochaetaceae bacterium]
MKATVLKGINNIFTVQFISETQSSDAQLPGTQLCRIKGKVLPGAGQDYNPLAPGDMVEIDNGLIISRYPRKNRLYRWNRKRNNLQVFAANIDQLLIFGSVKSPPLRPRFIDRVLVMAENAHVDCIIVINKLELGPAEDELQRLETYRQLGYKVIMVSAYTGAGLDTLKHCLQAKRSVLYGQSGVGKSSCLNALFPHLDLSVGGLSKKHNRGTHTTNYGVLLEGEAMGGLGIIDTPGIRELHLPGYTSSEVASGFRDIHAYGDSCEFDGCTHVHEPGCKVKKALADNLLHPDRYQSYLNILSDNEFLQAQYGVLNMERE